MLLEFGVSTRLKMVGVVQRRTEFRGVTGRAGETVLLLSSEKQGADSLGKQNHFAADPTRNLGVRSSFHFQYLAWGQ